MEVGIIGLPKVGKTTLFNTLTSSRQSTDAYQVSNEINVAVALVPDSRLVRLRDHYQPKKFTPATVTYVDIPGMQKGGSAESLDLARLREVDALAHVVRAFSDPEVLHSEGSIDTERDVEIIDLELILADLEIVTRRLERLEKNKKKGLSPDEIREQALLAEVILPTLEQEQPLRTLDLSPEDEKRLRGFQLLSAKPILLVINVDEEALRKAGTEARHYNAGLGVFTGGAGRSGRLFGSASMASSISCTARSSCGSRPSRTALASVSTTMSGSTPIPSMIQLPSRAFVPNSGTLTEPPSISGPRLVIPVTPPQERLPIKGPRPASRK